MRVNLLLWMNIVVCFILLLPVISAVEWAEGSLHQHTAYSTALGPDGIPFGGDGCSLFLEGHLGSLFVGYTVAELKEGAMDQNLDWLAFSDHSYCINSTEFNTVKEDCQNVEDASFTCLWGEELSTTDNTDDIEIAYGCDPTGILDDGEAHIGAYGINNLINQTPQATHCPDDPTAQGGINAINNQGGISILNHPKPNGGFLDFESYLDVSGETGIEIWNKEWDIYDTEATEAWINLTLDYYHLNNTYQVSTKHTIEVISGLPT